MRQDLELENKGRLDAYASIARLGYHLLTAKNIPISDLIISPGPGGFGRVFQNS